jgi:hypothetical protein
MTIAMQPIYTQTITSAGSNVTFNNIPQTFTDLMLKISLRPVYAGAMAVIMSINGSTANGSRTYLFGNGSGTGSGRNTAIYPMGANGTYTANTFTNAEIYIPNYASSNFKSISSSYVAENNASTASLELIASLWSQTAAITSLGFSDGSAGTGFAINSTFTLYGITKG